MIDPIMVERLADVAWPAAEQAPLGPWKLRATHGVTRRANSVLTAGEENVAGAELAKLVETAEGFYDRRSLPAVFQISAATGTKGLDVLLAGRGYAVTGVSEVWALDATRLKELHGKTARTRDDLWRLRWEDEPDEEWFACAFDEALERRRVHEQIVRRVPRPRLFVSAIIDGVVAGCGMAASAQGHSGIFCMATRSAYQRRGIGLAVVRELCAWGAGLGDERLFLQVMSNNEAAKELYRKTGFEFAYGYHYRVK